jgi:dynein heavy chain
MLKKLPSPFNIESIQAKYPVQYNESMNTVLVQECIRYNRLTDIIRSTLQSLKKALLGEVVMSRDIELLANSIFDGQIPDVWSVVSYPSLKPLSSYIQDLLSRLRFFSDWIEFDIPSIVHLPSLYFTQSFLTGVLQNYARRYRIAIDEVNFDFTFINPKSLGEKPSHPEFGAYIKGLFLEGASWDFQNECLSESHPKVLFSNAPVIWLKPCRVDELKTQGIIINNDPSVNLSNDINSNLIQNNNNNTFDTSNTDITDQNIRKPKYFFECPVYRTTARRGILSTTGHSTNFVMSIRLPSVEPPQHWIERGVALICSLSE